MQMLVQFQEMTNSKPCEHAQNRELTCETLGWLRIGWMFSVTRSAQADVSTVATMRMTKDLHLDQWTTAPWFPVTAQRARLWTAIVTRLLKVVACDFSTGDTCLVLLQPGCHRCGSESSVWRSDQWCKQLAGERTLCTPKAWWQEQRRETRITWLLIRFMWLFLYSYKSFEWQCRSTIQG